MNCAGSNQTFKLTPVIFGIPNGCSWNEDALKEPSLAVNLCKLFVIT